MRHTSLYSTYGAYELKASYQWNLLKSNGLVLSLFVTTLVALWIASLFAPPTVLIDPPIGPDTLIRKDWPTQPRIKRDFGPIVDERKIVDIPAVGIPTPIPDEDMTDDNTVIPTRAELGDIVDNKFGSLISDSGNYTFSVDDIDDGLPEPETFIPVDRMPEMVTHVQPEYPRMAKQMGLTGVVYIQALVDINGSVLKAQVKKSSDSPILDEAALDAAFKNKYSPALRANTPIRVWVVYKVVFELD